MLAYHDLLMPPTYLDEYRRKKADQSRSQQSTGNVPPNADGTLANDQLGGEADGVRPVRHVASRLTGLVDDSAPIGPDEPSDPYMDKLIDGAQTSIRRREQRDLSDSWRQPAPRRWIIGGVDPRRRVLRAASQQWSPDVRDNPNRTGQRLD